MIFSVFVGILKWFCFVLLVCNYLVEKLPSCVICQVDRQAVKHFMTNKEL